MGNQHFLKIMKNSKKIMKNIKKNTENFQNSYSEYRIRYHLLLNLIYTILILVIYNFECVQKKPYTISFCLFENKSLEITY